MTILEKIQQAQSKQELDGLAIEIILSANYKECMEAFKARLKELEVNNGALG